MNEHEQPCIFILGKDHQFLTILDNAAQERDLQLYLRITPPFSNWTSYCEQNKLWQSTCLYEPQIVVDSYKSLETNFEWRHFDGTKLDYFGNLASVWQDSYSSFSGTNLSGEC